MKTILITFLLGSLMCVGTITASASGIKSTLIEESYVNDIPFSTEAVFRSLIKDPLISIINSLKEEPYVNDIPFNTEDVAQQAGKIELEDEAYVDDIPFDTEEIAKNCQ